MQNVLKYIVILACGSAGLFAQPMSVSSFPHRGPANISPGTYPGIAATSVTVSRGKFNVTGCYNCVPGITGSVSLDNPRYLFYYSGMQQLVTLLIEDASYTGPCNAGYILTEGSFTESGSSEPISGGCVAGNDYVLTWSGGGTYGIAPASLSGWVGITPGSAASVVEEPLVISNDPPPPGVIGPSTLTIGVPQPGLPCYNCAPSMPAPNISIPTPLYVVPSGEALQVTMEIEDVSYTGSCTFVYQIKQGTTIIADGAHTPPSGCSSATESVPTWRVTIPSGTPGGPAILSGGVKAGGQTYAMYQPILIQ